MEPLSQVGLGDLDHFHRNHLQPNEEFLQKARRAIHSICEYLKASCFQDGPWRGVRVSKAVMGGSLGKGTSMKKGSDADLVLSLNIFHGFKDPEKDRKMIIDGIERRLNECKELLNLEVFFEKSKWLNPRVLSFKLRSKESDDSIEFDVLPAYDALGESDGSRPNPLIYIHLIWTDRCGAFFPCFTELLRDFIQEKPTKLKNLIRLVKHWYKEVQEESFPPKYALELLTVYAWEQGSRQDEFDTAEGFRTVLWLIEHYKKIRIYWTKYYDFDIEIIKKYLQAQLRKKRPVILDPADPTANFGQAKGWDRLAKKAKSYASMTCCRKQDGSLVEPWNVPADSAHSVRSSILTSSRLNQPCILPSWQRRCLRRKAGALYYEEAPCGSETLGWKPLNGNALWLLILLQELKCMGKSGIKYQSGMDEDVMLKANLV